MSRPQGGASLGDVRQMATLIRDKVDPAVMGLSAGKLTEFLRYIGSSDPRDPGPDAARLQRWQDDIIADRIPEGASVLDLGCGNGDLLARLMEKKHVHGQGVELDPEAVIGCVRNGVPVVQVDLDEGLKEFPDHAYDFVVLEQTLQTLHRPLEVVDEMLRVGRNGIVSFPNFAYWRVRLDLAFRGRMPVTQCLPYRWHDTPNIHPFALADFLDLMDTRDVAVAQGYVLTEGEVRELEPADNLHAEEALLFLEKEPTA